MIEEQTSMERAARMCPVCGNDSKVYRGTERRDGVFVRRRQCLNCSTEFETLEVFSGYVKKYNKKLKNAVSDGQEEKRELQ